MRQSLAWMLALRGAAALAFGFFAVVWPTVTVTALSLLFGVYALIDGTARLVGVLRPHKDHDEPRTARASGGLFGVAAGFLAVAWLGFTGCTLVILIGAWAMATGATETWAVLRSRGVTHERVLLMTGAAAISAGLLLWLRPDHGANAIADVTGGYALISGGLMLAVAWRRDTMILPPKATRRI
ncbi:HdeD family acid-resistance protein [Streptomyces mutabilis]|uniref:HdeD family acid-resistance protein n=1 Tax=Streptomyces TaxID=1883 RepID=UPI00368CE8B2